MSYVVLARKWRPAQFADIVGQNHIVRTLVNAIRAERIHQAYLFTGSRGIGKTSIARIFAKVLRCEDTRVEGDWLRSCDACASCREITSGTSVDVIEIDGASNNGVDAVREIRENAKYLPSTGKRKIYIIDEVHMLTTAAFNALLKTLEEPPPHVFFIFATTEPHKIPATILSRCQRFDYRRVTIAQIQARIAQVIQEEGIQADAGAISLIARAAEGSMRDALSLLDQVIAFAGNHLTVQSVRESVGLIEGQTLVGILNAIFSRKPLDALSLVDQAYQRGHDLRVLTRSLIEFLHATILAKIGATNPEGLELSEEEWKELRAVSELRSLEEIEVFFQILHNGLEWIARSPQPKVVLDILLVKCATAEAFAFMADDQTPVAATPAAPHQPQMPASVTVPAAASVSPPAAVVAPVSTPVSKPAPAPAPVKTPVLSPAPTPSAVSAPGSWEGFIEHARKTRPMLATLLEHGNCVMNKDAAGVITGLSICFPPKHAHYRDQLQSRVYQESLHTFSREYFGKPTQIIIEIKDVGESMADKRERVQKDKENQIRDTAQNHPLLREAKSLFGGEMGPIELNSNDKEDSDE